MREAVARHALRRPMAATEIVLCQIPGNPVCLGAATFALEGYLAAIGTDAQDSGLTCRVR